MDWYEFNKRCHEVFWCEHDEEFYSIKADGDDITIHFSQDTKDHGRQEGFYYPDMKERPEALAYLLGKTDHFND